MPKYNIQNVKGSIIGEKIEHNSIGSFDSQKSQLSATQTSKEEQFDCFADCFESNTQTNEGGLAAAGDSSLFWKEKTELLVFFMENQDLELCKRVIETASEWTPHSTIVFKMTQSIKESHIRVTFVGSGYRSALGVLCLGQAYKNKSTMTLGNIGSCSPSSFKRHVLHEFGHALGLIHEHQQPSAKIPWNEDKVFPYYNSFGWSFQKTNRNVLSPARVSNFGEFDPDSIMLYPIRKELLDSTALDYALFLTHIRPQSNELSVKDKAFFKDYYLNLNKN